MADPKVVSEWLDKAKEDLSFANSLIDESPFFAQICFHYHQAAEKFLKAFIVAMNLEFKKIHDLIVLLQLCIEEESSLEALMEDCRFLNAFYIETRYPVHWPTRHNREEAEKARTSAEHICEILQAALESKDSSVGESDRGQ
jgi:HEPN domain-containing protein